MTTTTTNVLVCAIVITGGLLAADAHAVNVTNGSAGDRDGLAATAEGFRAELGDLNAPSPGSQGEGRRQIDWDAAPDAVSAPNAFPGDFFNFGAFPRARGVVFTTDGEGFQLSATEASGVGIEFSNIDPSYDELFAFFSAERLFTPIGSNVLEIDMKVPGIDRDGLSHGFGAVFTDVDQADTTSMQVFDRWGNSLGIWYVEPGAGWAGDESLSFLGVTFDEPIVARVRVVLGTEALAWGVTEDTDGVDLVVMDDFFIGEPIPADPVEGDTDGTGIVDISDLLNVLASFGDCEGCPEDFNGDGVVDTQDLLIVLYAFD